MSSTITTRRMGTIQAALDELAQDDLFAIAYWTEADSDGGYLVARDGRMLAIGDYQHGFTHIDELLGERAEAKQELRQVSGNIQCQTEWTAEYGELPDELDAVLPALAAWSHKDITAQQVTKLRESRPDETLTCSAVPANAEVSLLGDVTATYLGQDDTGAWAWMKKTVGTTGDILPAFITMAGSYPIIQVVVEGGFHHRVQPEWCTIIQPPPEAPARPRCKA